MSSPRRRQLVFGLGLGLALSAVGARAQIVVSGEGAVAISHRGLSDSNAAGGAGFGIAVTPRSHRVELNWNTLNLEAIHVGGGSGAAVSSGLEAWLSPGLDLKRPGPVLLAEGAIGRQWGGGLSGFRQAGAGIGWRIGTVIPYLEYRDRSAFHAGAPPDRQLVIGFHWLMWD